MKKLLTLAILLVLAGNVYGAKLTQKSLNFINEWGDDVNMTTSVSLYIYDVGTTTEKTVYLDKAGDTSVTQPITDNSTNTALDYANGRLVFWCKDASYKITVTDGTYTRTLDNLTASDTRMMWPTFLVALSSYSLGQSEDLDFTYGAWVMDGDTAGRLDLIPDAADGVFAIGNSSGTTQGDVYVYASSTEYMYFDQSGAELNYTHIDVIVDDSSTLYFGDGKDVGIKFDNSNDDLDITGDGSELAIGASGAGLDVYIHGQTGNFVFFDEDNDRTFFEDWDLRINEGGLIEFADTGDAVDWTIKCSTAERLEFLPTETTDDQTFHIGDATHTSDVTIYGATASTYLLWDASDDELEFVLADLKISQGSQIEFIDVTDSATDWTIDNATDETLLILPAESTDDQSINLGNATYTTDLRVFGATASTVVFDASGDEVIFNAYDISLQDDDMLKFGDDDDFTIDSGSTTKVLDITPGAATDDYIVNFGLDQSGVDIKAFGTTSGDYMEWDASADQFKIVGDIFNLTLAEAAANAFKVDVTGTIAGDGIVLETTESGIQLLADGDTEGDIDIDCEDDMTLTAAGDLTLAVTGTLSAGGALLTNVGLTTEAVTGTSDSLNASQSGSIIVYTMTGGACTATLPEATATEVGVWYILQDGNPAAGNDLKIMPEGDGTINGDAAGDGITQVVDTDGCGALIYCTAADTWYAITMGSSTVWTED